MIKNISDLKRDDMFFLLAGPCVIEGEDMALRIAERVVKITDKLHIPYVFKGSYRKANRSRLDSFTGIGDEKALKILAKVRSTFDVPVVTDIHTASEAEMAAEYVDVLQTDRSLQAVTMCTARRQGTSVLYPSHNTSVVLCFAPPSINYLHAANHSLRAIQGCFRKFNN